MIKFFRKIRHKQLSKKKFSKYLIYAIGEIVLVVIGILIALQMNSWKENRKLNKEKVVLMEALKQDLKSDVTYLKICNRKLDSTFQILRNQSQYVNRISYSKDSLISFLKNDIDIRSTIFQGFNNTTYESIKTSGKLDLLDDSLKEKFYELSILQNSCYERYKVLRNDYYDEIEIILANYPIPLPESFIKNTPQNEFIWKKVEKKDIMLKLNSWGTMKANFNRSVVANIRLILEKTKANLNFIEKSRNKDL